RRRRRGRGHPAAAGGARPPGAPLRAARRRRRVRRQPPGRLRRHLARRRAARGRIALGRPGQQPPADRRGRRDLRQRAQGLRPGRPLQRRDHRRGVPEGPGRGDHAQAVRQRRRLVDHHRAGQGAHGVPSVRSRIAGARGRGDRPDGRQYRRHLAARRAHGNLHRWRAVRGARRPGCGRHRLERHRPGAGASGVPALTAGPAHRAEARRAPQRLLLSLLLALPAVALAAGAPTDGTLTKSAPPNNTGSALAHHAPAPGTLAAVAPEPNTLVPAGDRHYAPAARPGRIVASPAADPARGFQVAWRTAPGVDAPLLEVVVAGDPPDTGLPRRLAAHTTLVETDNGPAARHRVAIDGLQPDTLHAFRVQGGNGWWSPWRQLRTAAASPAPLEFLYFGDTQNKNASHGSRVL